MSVPQLTWDMRPVGQLSLGKKKISYTNKKKLSKGSCLGRSKVQAKHTSIILDQTQSTRRGKKHLHTGYEAGKSLGFLLPIRFASDF